MILIKRAVSGLTLALALTVSASCSDHNSALVGRDALPARAGQPIPDEFVATVEPVNTSSNEILSDRAAVALGSSLTVVKTRIPKYDSTDSSSRQVQATNA
jgi:hypothetical protein